MAKSNKAPAFHQPMLFDTSSPQSAPMAQASPIAQPAPTTSEAAAPPKSNSSPNPGDLVVLVDSHSLIYQVFHALPPMTSPHGVEVGAVHGFLRDVSTLLQQWKPTYLICAFDASEETFRNKLYPEYKAHREEMPDALRGQIGLIQQALELLGIPILSIGGFEADDILATLAHQASNSKARVLLVTSDKDCRQLINPLVSMLNIRKNELFGEQELMETWAIRPDQVVDFQAMVGDSVDNVPGVPSIGPKAAQQLLAQFDSLDNIYANIQKVAGDKKREKLLEHRDQAYLSQQLVRLSLDTPVPNDWSHLQRSEPNPQKLEELFRDFGFRRLAETLLQSTRSNQVSEPSSSDDPNLPIQSESTQYLQSNHRRRLPTDNYRCVNDLTMLEQLIGELSTCQSTNDKWIAIDTETTSTKARQAQLVGISLAWGPGQAAYIPILSPNPKDNLPIESVRSHLAPLLADPNYRWIGQNIKFDLLVLRSHQMPLNNVAFDTMVADYLLDAGGRNHDLGDIAKRWLEVDSVPITELIGTGKSQKTMDKVPLDLVAHYACEDVDIPVQIAGEMLSRLKSENLDSVLYNLELPLIDVLASMEFLGVAIDLDRLAALKADFQSRLDAIHSEVLELAGETFNPDSPKQLSAILFDKLKLRVVKKPKQVSAPTPKSSKNSPQSILSLQNYLSTDNFPNCSAPTSMHYLPSSTRHPIESILRIDKISPPLVDSAASNPICKTSRFELQKESRSDPHLYQATQTGNFSPPITPKSNFASSLIAATTKPSAMLSAPESTSTLPWRLKSTA